MVCLVLGFSFQLLGLVVAVAGVYSTKRRYAPHSPGLRAKFAGRTCGLLERLPGDRITRPLCVLLYRILRLPPGYGTVDATLPRVVADMDGAVDTESEHVRVVPAEDASQREVVGILLDQVAWLRAEVSRLDGQLSGDSAVESRMGELFTASIAKAKVDGWATEAFGLVLVFVGTVLAFIGPLQGS